MPRIATPVIRTEEDIKAIEPTGKLQKLPAGEGLYLWVSPDATDRRWRFRYNRPGSGKDNTLSLGKWPALKLKAAQGKASVHRGDLAKGIDPGAQKTAQKAAKAASADTFAAIGKELLEKKEREGVSAGTIHRDRHRLDTFLVPYIGDVPIKDLKAPELLKALKRVEAKGKYETATRTKELAGQICRYAVASGRADYDVSSGLEDALVKPKVQHFAAITEPAKVGALLRAIEGYDGVPTVAAALRLLPLVFTRPGELRQAEWTEFELESDQPTWRVPKERMKMRDAHVVPLSRQAVAILKEIRRITGDGRLVFPGPRTSERPISDNTMNAALRRMGYTGDQIVSHGFRSMASTLLHELGHDPQVIELQLAHRQAGVAGIYNRSARLPERRTMMQAWADYLDGLKAGTNNVVPIRAGAQPISA
jgi:integrase